MSSFVRMVKTVAVTVGGAAAAWYAWQRWWREAPPPRRRPRPESEPDPEPAEAEAEAEATTPVTLKGVEICDPTATLAFANEASEADLATAGLSAPQRAKVVGARPFADVATLGSTKGIGPKTLSALSRD